MSEIRKKKRFTFFKLVCLQINRCNINPLQVSSIGSKPLQTFHKLVWLPVNNVNSSQVGVFVSIPENHIKGVCQQSITLCKWPKSHCKWFAIKENPLQILFKCFASSHKPVASVFVCKYGLSYTV